MSEEESLKGFDIFSDMIKEYASRASENNVLDILELAAKDFTDDVRALPKPRSSITAPGYTHLLDTVGYQRGKNEVITGWKKYYGPMAENGTVKMGGVPHMRPAFERNKGKYYEGMQERLFG